MWTAASCEFLYAFVAKVLEKRRTEEKFLASCIYMCSRTRCETISDHWNHTIHTGPLSQGYKNADAEPRATTLSPEFTCPCLNSPVAVPQLTVPVLVTTECAKKEDPFAVQPVLKGHRY